MPNWGVVLDELDARRAAAFAGGDPSGLREVYAASSPAADADRAAVAGLGDRDAVARGVRHHLVSVAATQSTPTQVRLAVVDTLDPAVVLGTDGRVLERLPGRGETSYALVLVRQGADWRVQSIEG